MAQGVEALENELKKQVESSCSQDSGVSDCSGTSSSGSSQYYVALYPHTSDQPDELSFLAGDPIKFISYGVQKGWYEGECNGKRGFFPANFTQKVLPERLLLRYEGCEIVPFEDKELSDCFIDKGATASVYKVTIMARRSSQNEPIPEKHAALKKFKEGFGQKAKEPYNKEHVNQLLRKEAQLIKKLMHENIIHLHGYCTDQRYFGLLLELCDGGSLRNLCSSIDPYKSIPLEILINWTYQVASGMAFLRERGLVHRDLKADNVLVKQKACHCGSELDLCPSCEGTGLNRLTLKIADFGTTRNLETVTGNVEVGTHAWLAPEAFNGQKWTEASDVWAFGVVMWEIVNRDKPQTGDRPEVFAFNVVQHGQKLEIEKHCPSEWKQIMQSCWQMDPLKRPTFRQLARDLKAYGNQVKGKMILVKPSAKKLQRLQENRRASSDKTPRIVTPDIRRPSSSKPSTPIVRSPHGSMQNLLGVTSGKIASVKKSMLSVVSSVQRKLSSSTTDVRSKSPRSSRESTESKNHYLSPNSISSGYLSASNPQIASPTTTTYDYLSVPETRSPSITAPVSTISLLSKIETNFPILPESSVVNVKYCSREDLLSSGSNHIVNEHYACPQRDSEGQKTTEVGKESGEIVQNLEEFKISDEIMDTYRKGGI